MQLSANYALKLPEGTDNVRRQDFVDNFTKIDTEMKTINDNSLSNVTATGTNAYVGSTDRIKSLGKGTKLTLFVGADATGNCSLNLNSYGVKNIKDSFGNIVTNLKKDIPYNLCYNGTDFILQGKGGGGDAVSNQVLSGKKFTNDSGPQTGTLDLSNLVSGNIKAGVNINGVQGSNTVIDTTGANLSGDYMLQGASGYSNGALLNGNIVQHGAYTSPTSVAQANGTLYVRIPQGAYLQNTSEGHPEINFQADGLTPDNIMSGRSILGMWGNAQQLHVVSAAVPKGTTKVYLGFQPKALVVKFQGSQGSYYIFYFQGFCWAGINGAKSFESQSPYIASIDGDGFTLSNVPTNGDITYEVIG